NFGRSADRLTDATTTVKIEGKKVAIKGSYYMSQPSPDVASKGTGGGIVSQATQGKTEFVAPGSLNVKAEGKNIQLLGDAMTNNGGSPTNAATMPGNQQAPAPTLTACTKEGLQKLADDCNKHINCKDGPRSPPKGAECTTLGTKKHKCCENAIKKHAEEHPECGFKSEVAYDKNTGKPLDETKAAEARSAANKAYDEHKAEFGIESAGANKVWINTFRAVGGSNTFIADVIMGDVNEPDACYDFKFNCEPVGPNPLDRMSDKQFGNYMICTGAEPEVIACNGADVAGC
ncbi:MAG: DUF4150 domain-containing protein, partial [Nitrososphaera sp.]|nr:DUF4150 domain-containing protein [Nitrososphaera sp.]